MNQVPLAIRAQIVWIRQRHMERQAWMSFQENLGVTLKATTFYLSQGVTPLQVHHYETLYTDFCGGWRDAFLPDHLKDELEFLIFH